jgi:hypothetical protein
MKTITTTTLTSATKAEGVVEGVCDGCRFTFFDSIFFVVTMWHREGTSRLKHGRRISRRQSLIGKLYTRIHELFVSTPQIAPTGETIIGVKGTLQL